MGAKNENGNGAKRCTILIDKTIYAKSKMEACGQSIKLYEYINNVLAEAVGIRLPTKIKHPSTKKPKIKVEKKEETKVAVAPAPVAEGTA